ncbi:MAG: DUF2914 domain-containing protein [Nitrospirae bacterium]|nr:DUF2914 domain-containing protein [Nitrospirota bacterium]
MKRYAGIVVFLIFVITAWMVCETYAQKGSAQAGGFKVERMAVCAKIENKEPVDVKEVFSSATEKVYVFIEFRDVAEDTTVNVIWRHGDKEMLKTSLPLKKGLKWRTYASKNLYGLKGNWKIELVDSTGKGVKALIFKVE